MGSHLAREKDGGWSLARRKGKPSDVMKEMLTVGQREEYSDGSLGAKDGVLLVLVSNVGSSLGLRVRRIVGPNVG